jgi:3-hydroxypropanoate dehydrogenase
MSEDEILSAARSRITDCRNRLEHLDDDGINLLFREARNHNWWKNKDVTDEQLREIWDMMKFGSTSSNTQPARIIFIRSQEAKQKLEPCLMPANQEKTMAAPVTALLAYDLEFYEDFARNYPVRPELGERFRNDAAVAEKFAFQQCTLQGAYLIMAIRAVGLDAGAMGGFNTDLADKSFLSGKNWKSNFLCNIGYGDLEGIKGPRLYRYDFDEVCDII